MGNKVLKAMTFTGIKESERLDDEMLGLDKSILSLQLHA